jgi:hypothetical protein
LAGAFGLAAAVASAQPVVVQTPEAGEMPASQARFQVRVMESVLVSAVQVGQQTLGSELRRVSPGITLFSGPARARGFRLDGYGMFFAVDVPALHRSVIWSVQTLSRSNADLVRAMQSIKRMVQDQSDPRMKRELEQAFRLVETQVGPAPPLAAMQGNLPDEETAAERAAPRAAPRAEPTGTFTPTATRPGSPGASASADAPPAAAPVLSDASYTTAVQNALVDAMLDYGATLPLGPDEWLTIAARENGDTMATGDVAETVTITLRIKGADLEALKSGRLSRDDVRRRVEVREF